MYTTQRPEDHRAGAVSLFPPVGVQSAFRCQAQPVSLPGGQGAAFRCGDIILKPCSDIEEARWIAQLHLDVQQVGFRLPQPVSATGGEWVIDGGRPGGLSTAAIPRDAGVT